MRLGARRGWTEFLLSLRSPQDQGFYVFVGLGTLGYLWLNRDSEVEGTSLLLPSVALPSILGALLAFGVVIGPAYALAMEREDGTLLRLKAVPHGIRAYVTGQLLLHSLGLLPMLAEGPLHGLRIGVLHGRLAAAGSQRAIRDAMDDRPRQRAMTLTVLPAQAADPFAGVEV